MSLRGTRYEAWWFAHVSGYARRRICRYLLMIVGALYGIAFTHNWASVPMIAGIAVLLFWGTIPERTFPTDEGL